jgi:hypothetical protein
MTDFMANFVADTGFVPQDTITNRAFTTWLTELYDTGFAKQPYIYDREVVRKRDTEKLQGIALRLAMQDFVKEDVRVILENIYEEAGLWAAVRPASSHATVAASGVTQVVKTTVAVSAVSIYHCCCHCHYPCCIHCHYRCCCPVAIMLVTSAGGPAMASGQDHA